MDTQIDALGLNNEPPSDEVELEIRKLQEENLDVLRSLDAEILELENRLEVLRRRRNTTQERTHKYQSILSPLRRLSPEILAEIFYQCLPTHRNPIIDAKESPILLTHICKFWRAAAIAEPRIWTRIYVTFEDLLSGHNWDFKRQHATNILRRRLNVFKRWISRCGTRPLSISVCFSSCFAGQTINQIREKSHRVVLEFLEFLARLSPRFEALELRMSIRVYRFFEAMIEASEMTNLALLRVEIPDYDHRDNNHPIVLLQAPKLKQISIWADLNKISRTMDPSSMSAWKGLTDISIHGTLTAPKLIFLLEHATNLVHFKADVVEEDNLDDNNLLSVSHKHGNISLPFLRTFAIMDNIGPDTTKNLGLYNRIDAPGLIWVQYTGTLYSPTTSEGEEDHSSIVALLRRLPALKKLTIIDQCDRFQSNETTRVFRVVPSITHLFLGYEERSPAGYLVRNPPSNPFDMYSTRDAFCLLEINDLMVPPNVSNTDSNTDLPLLPNLVSLEISNRTLDIQDRHLIKFVINRMKLSLLSPSLDSANGSCSRIAKLKHVGVVFYRPKRTDIAAKIQNYAKRVGADMVDLFLDYPEPVPPEVKPIASEYGLRALDGRSWNHIDAEEFTPH